MELQKVVCGGDQTPFRARGRPASSFEAPDPAVDLDLGEVRLEQSLAPAVEGAARLAGEHPAHEVIGPAAASPPWPGSSLGVGGDEGDDALLANRVDAQAVTTEQQIIVAAEIAL